jgi:hypothetical protein
MRKCNKANVIDVNLALKPFQVKASRIAQVVNTLCTRVEE